MGSSTVPTYYMNEGAFELSGASFRDRTTHVFAAAHAEHGEVDVLVHRGDFPEGKSLRELVAAHLEVESKRLRNFAVFEAEPAEVQGLPALTVASRYREENGRLIYQRQMHLGLGARWMYFAVVAPMPLREACDGWLAHILGSLKLRGEA
jgi:hypothetical protein